MSTTSRPVESMPCAKASLSGGEVVRLSMPTATVRPPRRCTSVPYARPTSAKTSGRTSMPTLPRTSYARKMYGLMSVTIYSASDDRDGFDLDEPLGLGEGGHGHEGRGRALLAEELFAHLDQVLPMPDVGQVGVDLDDTGHGAAARFHLGFDRAKDFPRLSGEVPAVSGLALAVVGDLPRDEENALGARDFDALRVRGWVEHAGGAVPLDLCHVNLLEGSWVLGEYYDAVRVWRSLR